MHQLLSQKQIQFNTAMEKYENITVYKNIGQTFSFINVSFQVILAFLVFQESISPISHIIAFVAAFILTDFINGLVHMYMDNNDHYESLVGPLVANFHLHHKNPKYKPKNIFEVYYHESGFKIWLAFVLVISVVFVRQGMISGVIAYGLLYFSVLSSIAEVSHYLCHVQTGNLVRYLGHCRILLPIRHHARHHITDNLNYAFLNGITDPLLNIIAKRIFNGYKNTTDLHYAHYIGKGTKNRE